MFGFITTRRHERIVRELLHDYQGHINKLAQENWRLKRCLCHFEDSLERLNQEERKSFANYTDPSYLDFAASMRED